MVAEQTPQLGGRYTGVDELSATRIGLPGHGDAELVDRARAGEHAAWREIYERCYTPVYRYVRSRVWDETAAEDVAAEVFVAAVKGIGRYRHQGKPVLAWLFGIAAHAVADHQREIGRQRRLSERLWPFGSRGNDRASERARSEVLATSGEDDRLIQSLDLAQAISGLTPPQRELMTLRYFVGLETPEIAAIMGKDAAAVYSLHARALVALRGLLTEEILPTRDESRPQRTISTVEA